MTSAQYAASLPARARAPGGWFSRAETWLDSHGKGAWIATMVLGFILFWPLGLALLAYMIWSKRMFSKSCHGHWGRHDRHGAQHSWHAMTDSMRDMGRGMRPTGNAAFDAYKAETIRRLIDEQEAFEAFLQRLRDAKDKSEFDAFMEDRARAARAADAPPPAEPPAAA